MKTNIAMMFLSISLFVVILVVIAGIESSGHVTENQPTKEDMNKLLDSEYLKGLKDGTHCSVLESKGGEVYKDKICVEASERILNM